MTIGYQQVSDFKLFVGNMPADVSHDEIMTFFSPYGEISEVYIMSGSRSRSGQSSAFVKFATLESCYSAISGLHLKVRIRDSDQDPVSVKFAKSGPTAIRNPASESMGTLDGTSTAASTPASTPLASPSSFRSQVPSGLTKLFVGGLPTYVDRDDLIAMFTPFGKVESVHLMNNSKSKSGQWCAFINFYSRNEAQGAIDSLGGKYVVDADLPAITVRFADKHEEGNKRQKLMLTSSDETARYLAEHAAMLILEKA